MTAKDAYRILYDQAPIPMVTVRDDGRVVDANTAFCEASRTSREDLVDAAFVDQLTAQDRGTSRVFLRQSLERGVAEWGVSLAGVPDLRWKVRAVSFWGRVVVLMLWTPSSQDVPRTLVPALAHLMRRVPDQAVLLLSADLWVLGAWGMPEIGGPDDGEILGRHLGKLAGEDDTWVAELSACLLSEESWNGRMVLSDEGFTGLDCVADLVPSRVVGGSRDGAGFVVLRPAPRDADSGHDRRRLNRMARVGDFTVALVDGVRERLREAVRVEPGSADDLRARLEIEALDRRLKQFTEVARTDGSVFVSEVIEGLSVRWTDYLAEQEIEFVVEPCREPVRVALTEEVASGVLDELIENARAALADAKERRIVVRPEVADGGVVIRVEDSGPGVSRAQRETVFRAFYSRSPGRLGLGLAAARTQVELRGGALAAADPAGGKGAAFVFTLPVVAAEVEAESAAEGGAAGLRSPRLEGRSVLLVEESDDIRQALTRVLTDAGMDVREAWSGRSALAELLQRGATDTVVVGLRNDDGATARFVTELRDALPELARRTVVFGDVGAAQLRRTLAQRLECPVLSRPILVHELLESLEAFEGSGSAQA